MTRRFQSGLAAQHAAGRSPPSEVVRTTQRPTPVPARRERPYSRPMAASRSLCAPAWAGTDAAGSVGVDPAASASGTTPNGWGRLRAVSRWLVACAVRHRGRPRHGAPAVPTECPPHAVRGVSERVRQSNDRERSSVENRCRVGDFIRYVTVGGLSASRQQIRGPQQPPHPVLRCSQGFSGRAVAHPERRSWGPVQTSGPKYPSHKPGSCQ